MTLRRRCLISLSLFSFNTLLLLATIAFFKELFPLGLSKNWRNQWTRMRPYTNSREVFVATQAGKLLITSFYIPSSSPPLASAFIGNPMKHAVGVRSAFRNSNLIHCSNKYISQHSFWWISPKMCSTKEP